jgi:hypothetical protein
MPTPKLQQASVSTALRTICDAPPKVLHACGDLTEVNAKIIQALLPTPQKEKGATETVRLIAAHAEGAIKRGLLETPEFYELQKEIEGTVHERHGQGVFMMRLPCESAVLNIISPTRKICQRKGG